MLPVAARTRAALVVAVAATLAGAPAAGAAPTDPFSEGYADTPGDAVDCSCADVTGVTVANDAAGLLTFTVTLANRATMLPDETMLIGLDTDSTATTGASGADRLVRLRPDGRVDLRRWTGRRYVARAAPSLTATYLDGIATISVAAADVEVPPVFHLFVSVRGAAVTEERAPDGTESFRYVLGGTAPRPAPLIVDLLPGRPRLSAPGALTLLAAVVRSDTNAPLASGSTRCTASAGGAGIPAFLSDRPRQGFASCTWLLPGRSAGKLVRARIAVTAFGRTVSRTVVRRVAAG